VRFGSAQVPISQRLGVSGVVILRTSPGGAIVAGDIIVAVNGQAIDSVARLHSCLDDHEVGATVRLHRDA
jgi:S1-C subfamily serine protease